ncbi:hypothetical protein L1987_46738 [Smallanthus sonchifolius]|uniref:Uncharacterized protein n=1 Tax=Smallanthus sonchifolius TaxID=185202 RepID=A0ACB9G149_9ASTR|nr:hypothetical protein L1987_46738 [Smallanthus sonchifolius]
MTVKGGSRPACAACRFQRRRCSLDCALAPFFPATQPEIFHNVHSLYGVGHILKILNQLKDDEEKEEAMKSIIYESNIRQTHRVHGCYGVIVYLQQKVVESMRELRSVLLVLDACKKKHELAQNSLNDVNDLGGSSDWMMNGGSDLGFYYNVDGDHVASYDRDDQTETTVDVTPNQSRFDEFQRFYGVEQGEESIDYTEIMCGSFVDDQQSFMGSKEACDLKLESPLEDTTYFIEPQELKVREKLYGVHCSTTGF